MGFVYSSSVMNSKGLVNCFVWNHKYFEEMCPPQKKKKKKIGSPQELYHRFMYIASSSDANPQSAF